MPAAKCNAKATCAHVLNAGSNFTQLQLTTVTYIELRLSTEKAAMGVNTGKYLTSNMNRYYRKVNNKFLFSFIQTVFKSKTIQ